MSRTPLNYLNNLEKIMKTLGISMSSFISCPDLFKIISNFLTTGELNLKIKKGIDRENRIYLSYSQLEKDYMYFDGSVTSVKPLLLIVKKIPDKKYSLRVYASSKHWNTKEIKKTIEQLKFLIVTQKVKLKITPEEDKWEEEFIDIVTRVSAKDLTKKEVFQLLETVIENIYVKKYKGFGITGEAKIALRSNNFFINATCVETDHIEVKFFDSNIFEDMLKIFNDTFLSDLKSPGYCLWYIKFLNNKKMQLKTPVRNYEKSKQIIKNLVKLGASNKEAIYFSKYYMNPIKSFENYKSKKVKGMLIRETHDDLGHRKNIWSFVVDD